MNHPNLGLYRAGFTLVEILAVLSILALVAGLLAPVLLPSASSQLKHNTSLLLNALRDTRLYALRQQVPASLLIDTAQATFQVPGRTQPNQLAGDLHMQVATATQEVLDAQRAGIRFFPDGRSGGGRITLHQADQIQHIDIAWLTGRIQVHATTP